MKPHPKSPTRPACRACCLSLLKRFEDIADDFRDKKDAVPLFYHDAYSATLSTQIATFDYCILQLKREITAARKEIEKK